MAPAIELVLVSQGAIKAQRCAKGAPRALDEIEVSPQRERAGALRPAQSPPKGTRRRSASGAPLPALRARRNPPL